MKASEQVVVRYWHRRDTEQPDDGAVADYGLAEAVGYRLLVNAVTNRCTVLLGSPGAGKSTELRRLKGELTEHGSDVHEIDVRLHATGPGLLAAFRDLAPSGEAARPGYVIVDALDESPVSAKTLALSLMTALGALPEDVRIVLACRTAAWNPALESELARRFGDVEVLLLAPLTNSQIRELAEKHGVDGAAFFTKVINAGARELAMIPITAQMLLHDYGEFTTDVGRSQTSLYGRAIVRLLEEPDPYRESGFTTYDKRGVASYLAALALLTGTRGLWVGRGSPPSGCLQVEQLVGARVTYAHPTGPRDLVMERELLDETLASGLFEGTGKDAFWFKQQSFAEYLAAHHLTEQASPDQVESLLRGSKGLVAPQIQALAAWLVALSPQEYSQLVADDPVAFLFSGTELVGDDFRASLLQAILELASRNELPHQIPPAALRNLNFDGVDQVLQGLIEDPDTDFEVKYLAIRIARQNVRRGLTETLIRCALNEAETIPVRNAAGHAALAVDEGAAMELSSLLVSHPDDTSDQLFGVGVAASLAAGKALPAVLQALHPPRDENLFGSYRMALVHDLPDAVSSLGDADLLAAASDWAVQATQGASLSGVPDYYEHLLNAILVAVATFVAADEPTSHQLEPSIDQLVAQQLERHSAPLLTRSRRSVADLSEGALEAIFRSCVRLFEADPSRARYGAFVVCGQLASPRSFFWFVERALTAPTASESAAWAELVRATFAPSDRTHIEICLNVPDDSVLYREVFATWREPVILGSDEARHLKEMHAQLSANKEPRGINEDALRALLAEAIDSTQDDSFMLLCRRLLIRPGEEYVHDELAPDITSLPGWQLLTDSQKRRVRVLAARYLQTQGMNLRESRAPNTFTYGEMAGARAIVHLSLDGMLAPEVLTSDVLKTWRLALLRFPVSSGEEAPLDPALRLAYVADPAGFLSDLELTVAGDEHGHFLLSRIASILDTASSSWLATIALSPSSNAALTGEALGTLFLLDRDRAQSVLANLLDLDDLERAVGAALGCVGTDLKNAWSQIFRRMENDSSFAVSFIERATQWEQIDVTHLADSQVADLWRLCVRLFPTNTDPHVSGVHSVSSRESAANFRDQLPSALANRGTSEAVVLLEQLALTIPEHGPWLRRLRADAQRRLARSEWTPSDLSTVVALLSDPRKRLLRSNQDLLKSVVAALGDLQGELTATQNAAASILWNHAPNCSGCRPKSEDDLNDYVARHLRGALTSLVVSREVEVARKSTSGIGERPDLLVTALVGEVQLTLVIEGKGSWNREVQSAVADQLVPKYLAVNPDAGGLLLAYWFGRHHGDMGHAHRDVAQGDLAQFEEMVLEQAVNASTEDQPIQGFVLDLALDSWSS